ncbi:MAG: hypothetical protein R3E48_11070 [Burkholderiaceae bacterium]
MTASSERHALFGTRLGATLYCLGALGLIVTSAFYALAGPAAALPGGAAAGPPAMAATSAAAGWMRMAGLVGMPSDVLLALGALLIAHHEYRRAAPGALAGWLAMAIAAVVFIVVDAMVATVLPTLALDPASESAYSAMRLLFDTLFVLGALTAGCGAMASAWSKLGIAFRRPLAGWMLRIGGLVCLLASAAQLVGLPGGLLIGPGVALLAVASVGASLSIAAMR